MDKLPDWALALGMGLAVGMVITGLLIMFTVLV